MCDTRLIFSPNIEKINQSIQLQKDVDEWLMFRHNKIIHLPYNVHKNDPNSGNGKSNCNYPH